jgi:hypothetical protein
MTMTVAATKEAACKIYSDDDDSIGQSLHWRQLDTVVLADKFRELTNRWKQETRYLSSATRVSEHASYQEIMALGVSVIPLILEDLQSAQNHWFIALRKITGANPVPSEDVGNVTRMQHAWIRWGMDEGYIPRPRRLM